MNSIIQCLNNTQPLVEELNSFSNHYIVNKKSRTKGEIAREVISAFRQMWSGGIKTYSIQDLKTKMGFLYDIFQGSGHQDSHEFLILLLEHLHEDLNEPDQRVILTGALVDSGEKAWGEFKKKNSSIIQRLFYGQHKSTVICGSCGHESVTFEQFLNLFVPLPPNESKVSLEECIKLYMAGEQVSGWTCPECKTNREAFKKFYISKLPPILIIALKRFSQQDSSSWLHKKENLVTYRLRGLDMDDYIVPESEQRYSKYNLYAMSTHTGTMKSGHYRALCRNYLNEKWYMFDDQHVQELSEQSVRDNSEVYILFYSAVTS